MGILIVPWVGFVDCEVPVFLGGNSRLTSYFQLRNDDKSNVGLEIVLVKSQMRLLGGVYIDDIHFL